MYSTQTAGVNQHLNKPGGPAHGAIWLARNPTLIPTGGGAGFMLHPFFGLRDAQAHALHDSQNSVVALLSIFQAQSAAIDALG